MRLHQPLQSGDVLDVMRVHLMNGRRDPRHVAVTNLGVLDAVTDFQFGDGEETQVPAKSDVIANVESIVKTQLASFAVQGIKRIVSVRRDQLRGIGDERDILEFGRANRHPTPYRSAHLKRRHDVFRLADGQGLVGEFVYPALVQSLKEYVRRIEELAPFQCHVIIEQVTQSRLLQFDLQFGTLVIQLKHRLAVEEELIVQFPEEDRAEGRAEQRVLCSPRVLQHIELSGGIPRQQHVRRARQDPLEPVFDAFHAFVHLLQRLVGLGSRGLLLLFQRLDFCSQGLDLCRGGIGRGMLKLRFDVVQLFEQFIIFLPRDEIIGRRGGLLA